MPLTKHRLGCCYISAGQSGSLAGGGVGVMFSTCPSVRPSVFPFFRLLPNLWTRLFWKRTNLFWCQLAQVAHGQGHKAINFRVRKSQVKKVKVTRGRKYIWRPGGGIILDPLGSSRF